MPHKFQSNKDHTLGVEVELQLVDAETHGLSNSVQAILDQVPEKWSGKIKPELMQSYCEFNTDVCTSVGEVGRDLSEKLDWAQNLAQRMGLQFVWSGTHPFSPWYDQKFSPGERYAWLALVMQHIARRMVVFGLHVHVGVDSGDKAIQLCDRLLRHLPTLLALFGLSFGPDLDRLVVSGSRCSPPSPLDTRVDTLASVATAPPHGG